VGEKDTGSADKDLVRQRQGRPSGGQIAIGDQGSKKVRQERVKKKEKRQMEAMRGHEILPRTSTAPVQEKKKKHVCIGGRSVGKIFVVDGNRIAR